MSAGRPGRPVAGGWLVWLAAVCLWLPAPAHAVPPPPPRAAAVLDLPPDGREVVFRDEVRAYQYMPLKLHADAGDELLLRLSDRDGLLVLEVQAPSGLRWFTGAKPGPDGMRLQMIESGTYQLAVIMSGDAARAGKAASFDLRLRRRR